MNREYDLAQYQALNIHFVTSVPYTKQLIAEMRKEWKDFTTEKHRELLVKGFENGRSSGASIRLATTTRMCWKPTRCNNSTKAITGLLQPCISTAA